MALAKSIVKALNQPDLKEKAREINAHLIEQKAQWDLNIEKLTQLYAQVLERKD